MVHFILKMFGAIEADDSVGFPMATGQAVNVSTKIKNETFYFPKYTLSPLVKLSISTKVDVVLSFNICIVSLGL